MDQLDLLDYYTLLQIADDASTEEVQAAFHRFAMKFHPDRHVGATPEKRERAELIYRRGAEAYRVLSDPTFRARYDNALDNGELRISIGRKK